MTTPSQPARRSSGQPRQKPADARLRRQERDPYRPEYAVVLAVSPQMRARYPHSPLSLDEALQRGTRQPDPGTPDAGNQEREGGQVFWAELPGNLSAPRRARAAIGQVLASWGLSSLAPDIQLLASELVANAAEHAPGEPMGLLLRQTTTQDGRPGVRCEVADCSPELPPASRSEPDSERGRGLAIVTAVAADSGITARRDGKTAWFTLTAPDPSPSARMAEPEPEAGA